MTPISERQRALIYIYIYKAKILRKVYMHTQKARHFAKSKKICVTFLFTKSQTLYVTRFIMKFLKLAFIYIYQKRDTFNYVKFLYTRSQTLRKSETICVKFLYTKILTLCVTQFFMGFFKLAEGRGI